MSDKTKMGICPRCGSFKVPRICDYCKLERIETETTLDESMDMSDKKEKKLIEYYIKTLIKDTYDPEIAELSERWYLEQYTKCISPNSSGPCCPYCKSQFITKVTFFDRLLDTTVWGLASDMIGKTHKCNSCGATW